ncbi:MAG: galactose-1-epimerase, partial [Pedobacter sp.]
MNFKSFFSLILVVALLSACNSENKTASINDSLDNDSLKNITLTADSFKKIINGKKTSLYILKNANNAVAKFTNYGGRLVSLLIPNAKGQFIDVVVGFNSVSAYQKSTEPYFGATIGRYGNRIAKGKFNLDGKTYSLFTNNGVNTLHGGKKGFQYVVWDAKQPNHQTIEFTYVSKDMEEGFPGN